MMLKLKIFFAVLSLVTTTVVIAEEQDYIEQGEKGIEAFKEGRLIEAMGLLQQSADKGYAPAQASLAFILDSSEEDKAAFELYKKSALQQYPPGQYGLSTMYMKGEGVSANQVIAGRWMKLSARQGHVPAMRAIALAYEYGTLGIDKDLSMASEWFHECHDKGDMSCSRRLSRAYGTGDLGFAVNMEKAKELYELINTPTEEKK